jgi:hypothetical protein
MVERGKVWRNIVLPVLIGGAAVLTPLTFRSKTPLEDRKPPVVQVNQLRAEEEKQDTVYLPQAVIDSAFGWKYGNVKEYNDTIYARIKDYVIGENFGTALYEFIDIGDQWKIKVYGDGWIGVYHNNKSVAGFTGGSDIADVRKKLKSGELRFIKYTDKDGHNCLAVKLDDKTLDIYYAGIPGHGLIWIMDKNSPYTIGDIGFLPSDEGKNGKFLTILADIEGDGVVGIAISGRDKWFSEEMRFAKK